MSSARLYGFTQGWGSYSQVLKGFELGLGAHPGLTIATLPIEEQEEDDDEERVPLAEARTGIFLGPPGACRWLSTNARHSVRAVMVAPNSDRVPDATMLAVNREATLVLAPSRWAGEVLSQLTEHPVEVVPHGIHPGFQLASGPKASVDLEALYEAGSFRVLHLSSSGRERKGTIPLLRAFRLMKTRKMLPDAAELWLVLAPDARADVIEWLRTEDESALAFQGIRLSQRLGLRQEGAKPAELRELYQSVHVVCQPSRGEAFGMVPQEARAAGTPVVATTSTGHSEWARGLGLPNGVVPVPTGDYQPIDDVPGARAPSLETEDLIQALGGAYRSWHALKAAALADAPVVGQRWSWPEVLRTFATKLE